MKNKAKCRLCQSIIESFHETDYVQCKCGEIVVDGGNAFSCAAKNWDNFLRIDDQGKEIPIKIKEFSKYDRADMEPYPEINPIDTYEKPTKKDLIEMLKEMADNIENLPQNVMQSPITHYDHWSLVALMHSILKED